MPRSITGTLRRRPLRLAALLAAPVATVALLSGCGVGQVNQTDTMVPPVPGTSVDSKNGIVSLRNLLIKYSGPEGYPKGGTAPLAVFISNNLADRPVTLKSVTATDGKDGPSVGTVRQAPRRRQARPRRRDPR